MRLYQAIVIVLAAFAVLTAIQSLVTTVDISTIPVEYQGLWQGLVYIFTAGAATQVFTFLRNILGYAENWFETKPEKRAQLSYEANMLGATMVKFALYIYSFTAMIQALTAGTPYEQYAASIAGAIGIILDLIIKAVNDLGKPTTTSPP